MAYDPRYRTATVEGRAIDRAQVDEGLRSYMLRVYNYMALGVGVTGLVTMFMANNPQLMQTVAGGVGFWLLFIGILGLGFMAPRLMMTKSIGVAHLCYWTYAVLWGALIAPMIYVFLAQGTSGQMDVARAFFITAGMFAGMSLYGYTTKRDLSPMGRFLMMATIGILIAVLVNAFLIQSAGFHFILSFIVVLVFAALTAFETQAIKESYYAGDTGDVMTRKAIFGAFILYGSFVTMFIWVLNIIGMMRE